MSHPVQVTLIQFRVEPNNPRQNLEAMERAIEDHRKSDLIIFPELALHGHAIARDPASELKADANVLEEQDFLRLRKWVGRMGTAIFYGRLLEQEGRFYNMATYTDGQVEHNYAKTHVHWTEPYEAGTDYPVIPTPLGPTGMLICFDAAFPEVPRLLTVAGAKAIVNLSAIPRHFDLAYVHRRILACSTYNQVFTLFANRRGPEFQGGSAVATPRGELLALADEHQPSLTVELDLAEVDRWREEEPTLRHRRPVLYGGLTRQ